MEKISGAVKLPAAKFDEIGNPVAAAAEINEARKSHSEMREAVRLTPERIAARQAWARKQFRPQSEAHDGTNGLHRLWGAWPGDETDTEVTRALEALS